MRWHLYSMLFSMLVGLVGMALIVWQTTPAAASITVRVSFFLALYLFLTGSLSLISFWIHYRFMSAQIDAVLSQRAYKHGLAISTLALLILIVIRL